jgi:hypothetical protein
MAQVQIRVFCVGGQNGRRRQLALDRFYKAAVQHVKPWTQPPPKVRDSETAASDEPVQADDNSIGLTSEGALAGEGAGQSDDPDQVRSAKSLAAFPS